MLLGKRFLQPAAVTCGWRYVTPGQAILKVWSAYKLTMRGFQPMALKHLHRSAKCNKTSCLRLKTTKPVGVN